MNEHYQTINRLVHAEADMLFGLHVFGDHLAKQHVYTHHKGIDAVHYFLMLKHGWLPSQVKNMSTADLCFAIEEEMAGWTFPLEARP